MTHGHSVSYSRAFEASCKNVIVISIHRFIRNKIVFSIKQPKPKASSSRSRLIVKPLIHLARCHRCHRCDADSNPRTWTLTRAQLEIRQTFYDREMIGRSSASQLGKVADELFARGIRLQTGVNASPIRIPDTYTRYRPGNIGDRASLSLSLSLSLSPLLLPASGAITNKARFALRIKPLAGGFARRKNARGSNSSETRTRARCPTFRICERFLGRREFSTGPAVPRSTAQHERIQFRRDVIPRAIQDAGERCVDALGGSARGTSAAFLAAFTRPCVGNALAERMT